MGRSNNHLVSLDATKTFDKLWRNDLFYKLIDKVDGEIWRIIFDFYQNSKL